MSDPTERRSMPELPDDIELSRDVDSIVTATEINITCRRCWRWSESGLYGAMVESFRAHLEAEHPEVDHA